MDTVARTSEGGHFLRLAGTANAHQDYVLELTFSRSHGMQIWLYQVMLKITNQHTSRYVVSNDNFRDYPVAVLSNFGKIYDESR